jgi:hypothetical protein
MARATYPHAEHQRQPRFYFFLLVQRVLFSSPLSRGFRPDGEDNDEGLHPVRLFAVWHLPRHITPTKHSSGLLADKTDLEESNNMQDDPNDDEENKERKQEGLRNEPEKKVGHSQPTRSALPPALLIPSLDLQLTLSYSFAMHHASMLQ